MKPSCSLGHMLVLSMVWSHQPPSSGRHSWGLSGCRHPWRHYSRPCQHFIWVEGTPVGCLRHADDLVGSMQLRRHLQSGHQFLTKDSSTAGLRVTNSGACRPTGTAADGARGPLHACSTVVRSCHRSTRREVSYASGKPKWDGCVDKGLTETSAQPYDF